MKKFYATLTAVIATATAMALPTHSVGTFKAMPTTSEVSITKTMHNNLGKAELKYGGKMNTPVKRAFDAETWEDFGTGSFVEPVISSLYNNMSTDPVDVLIEKSTSTEGLYRIVEPYKNYAMPAQFTYDVSKSTPLYFVISGDYFYLEDWATGVDDGDGVMNLTTQIGGLYPSYPIDFIASYYPSGIGYYKDGVLTYPVTMNDGGKTYYNMLIWQGSEDAGYYRGNTDGQFKIIMPGATDTDYSINLDYQSCADDNNFTFGVTLGTDVQKYKFFAAAGEFASSTDNYQYVAQNGDEFTSSQTSIKLDLNGQEDGGVYTIFAVTVDEQGNAKEGARALVYVIKDDAENWVAVDGQATYTEAIISSIYQDVTTETYPVDIEKSKNVPGYYRLVNPYAEPYPYASSNIHVSAHKHYIYINASKSDKVYIEESPIGVEFGDGVMCVTSLAYRTLTTSGKTEADVDPANWGAFTDGVITFPAKTLIFRETKYDDGAWYYCNTSGDFKVVLPESEGVGDIFVDATNVPAEYFNLQGQRVDNPTAGQLVIRRQGTTVSKVMIK